jgi:hypothetical protein
MNYSTPSNPAPHQLADWLHQQFLSRTAPPAFEGPNPWNDAQALRARTAVADPIDLAITSRDLRSQRVGSIVDRLMSLSDTPVACATFQSRFRLVFEGYSSQPHEIVQIPEISHYFQLVTQQWPYWLHFLSPQAHNMCTLLNLTFKPLSVKVDGDRVISRLDLADPAMASFQNMVQATLNLHNAMGAPKEVSLKLGNQLRHALCVLLA